MRDLAIFRVCRGFKDCKRQDGRSGGLGFRIVLGVGYGFVGVRISGYKIFLSRYYGVRGRGCRFCF